MSLKFGQIRSWTAKLPALERLKKSFTYLRTIQKLENYSKCLNDMLALR